MSKINRENILSYFLAFVVFWFGINEILYASDWVGLVPSFLGTGNTAVYLVVFHGILLSLAGLGLVFNFYRRYAAILVGLLLIEIIISLLFNGGLGGVAVRDIGLLGIAFALSVRD